MKTTDDPVPGHPPPRRSEHHIVYVRSGSGRDLTGDGSVDRPFRTVGRAFVAVPHVVGPDVEWIVDARRDARSLSTIVDRVLCGLGARRLQAAVRRLWGRRADGRATRDLPPRKTR